MEPKSNTEVEVKVESEVEVKVEAKAETEENTQDIIFNKILIRENHTSKPYFIASTKLENYKV